MSIVSRQETLSREEELLIRGLDGELEGEALELFEASLRDDPAFREELEAGRQLRAGLREGYRQELEAVDFSTFWEGVARGLDALPARVPEPVPHGAGSSFLERFRAWMNALTWRPIAAGAMAVGLIASVGIFQLAINNNQSNIARVAPQSGGAVQAIPGVVIPSEPPAVTSGVEINSITAGPGSTVMVIRSPADATIIWVTGPTGGTAI